MDTPLDLKALRNLENDLATLVRLMEADTLSNITSTPDRRKEWIEELRNHQVIVKQTKDLFESIYKELGVELD